MVSSAFIPVSTRIARDLGIGIISGRIRAGCILNDEMTASGRLRISRSAYREAVRILAAKGLVETRPKIGTRVSALHKWNLIDPDVVSWMFAQEPAPLLMESLFELRRLLEPEAARLAAGRRSFAHLAKMSAALDEMEEQTLQTVRGRLADRQFHAALIAASGNVFMASMSNSITAAVAWSSNLQQPASGPGRDAVPDHRRVFEAVAAGDPTQAQAAMMRLLDLALTDAMGRRQPDRPGPV